MLTQMLLNERVKIDDGLLYKKGGFTMSLFAKKKEMPRPLKIEKMPSLPDFPDLPDEENLDFPSYESSIGDIKREVEKESSFERPDFEIPRREKSFSPKFVDTGMVDADKPLFVKIESYREAVKELDKLKEKLAQAEELLGDLEEIRTKETEKLDSWRRDIASLKEKLLSVDQHLFEA